MHAESLTLMRWLLKSVDARGECLDIGAQDVNGSYRKVAEEIGLKYEGADLAAGPNVNHVISEAGDWRSEIGCEFDLVISGQTLEHVRRPWRWIRQAASLLAPDGLLLLIVPHTCPRHDHPLDCWRVYPDGMKTLLDDAGLETVAIGQTSYKNEYKTGDTWAIASRQPRAIKLDLGKISKFDPKLLYDSTFATAKPFPHQRLNWYGVEFWSAEAAWPAMDDPAWQAYERHGKFAIHDLTKIPGPLAKFIERLNSQENLTRLSRLTGIPDLIADPTLQGAGLHEVRQGGQLAMHVDFNRLGDLYRRLNLLIYLNPDWKKEWGGCLYLGKNREVSIVPRLGTSVVFATSNESWHGHPDPVICPKPRRSIAMYYYTREPPTDYRGMLETTLYEEPRGD